MRWILIWVLLAIVLATRLIVYNINTSHYPDGTRLRLSGYILSEPRLYERSQLIELSNIRFFLPIYPSFSYGDYIVVEGVIKESVLSEAILVRTEDSTNILFTTRQKLLNLYRSALPVDQAALVSGMVLGSKSLISKELWDKFVNAGVAHVIVASGMNVALVAGLVLSILLNFLTRRKAIFFSILAVWLYALISGVEAPIIRATLMSTLFLVSQLRGKQAYVTHLLFLSAFIMLFVNPAWAGDLGFILSFTATLSLIIFGSKVDRLLYFVPKYLRGDLSTTLSAQILVAPILFLTFGRYNPLSLVTNAVVLWTVPLITTSGMLFGLIGLFMPDIGRTLLLLEYPLAGFFLFIVGISA